MMLRPLLASSVLAAAFVVSGGVPALLEAKDPPESDKPKEPKRPSISLRAAPGTGMIPIRVSATAEFKGGDDDFQEYYCPTVEWNWGDGTISESSADCEPYEAGVSQIRRRYTAAHNYRRSGALRITFRLKQKDKVVVSQSTPVRLLGGGF